MTKKVIAIQTDGPMMRSGLGRNGRALAKYLYNTGKYEVVYFAQQGYTYDSPELKKLPFRAYGVIPNNPAEYQHLIPGTPEYRDFSYGALCIDKFIQDVKPFAMIFSNDSWAFPYYDKPWWNKFHCIPHITLDSLPFQSGQIDFIKKSSPKHYVWAKFAEEESKRLGLNNVETIPALIEDSYFFNVGDEKRAELRKRHGISPDTFITGFVFRNQGRKEIKPLLVGFSQFKKEYPGVKTKLLLHTNFTEGWNIFSFLDEIGLSDSDILTTYHCKQCGQYEVKELDRNNHTPDCKFCGGKKTQFYCGIHGGVSEEQLNEVYNLMDLYLHPANAGGCEMPIIEALYAEIPVGTVSYSFGKTFTDEPFCFTIKNYWTVQEQTQFKRAVPCPDSIQSIIKTVFFSTKSQRAEIGKKSREFALKTFSPASVGKKWEQVLDSLPEVNWDYNFEQKEKNPHYPMPVGGTNDEFITLLYDNVLLQPEPPDGDGRKHWLKQLNAGISREEIYKYFVGVAINDNAKNKKFNPEDFFLKEDEGKRVLFYIEGNADDLFLTTALFKSCKEKYPDYSIYVSCGAEQIGILKGNPYITKVLPLAPVFSDPVIMKGVLTGKPIIQHLFIPNIQTSKVPTRIGGEDEKVTDNLGKIS